MKTTCKIETCSKETYGRGYCRNHYNSLIRHGDPLQAERNVKEKQLKAEQRKLADANKQKNSNNIGKTCKAPDCGRPAKIKGYCLKHDARIKRNGTLETKTKRSNIKVDECLVIGCIATPHSHGICKHHLNNIKELKTPLKPQIIRLCGVKGCDNPHMGNGMCNKHFTQWKAIVRDYKLAQYVELSTWTDVVK